MISIAIYIAAMAAANMSAAFFGPAVTPINSFVFIGLDLALRNWLGVNYTAKQMLALIAAAAAASYALNPATGQIAIASGVAFVCAALADWLTFKSIGGKWIRRCMGGVAVGAVVDSVLFPTIAFGGLMPKIVALQFAAKVAGGFVWSLAILRLNKQAA